MKVRFLTFNPSFSGEIYHFPRTVSVLMIPSMEQILVIGAGPAGSACAWRLSKAGLPCILADRSTFPRPKVCGGVLSSRAVSLLTESGMLSVMEIDDLTVQSHSTLTITSDYREIRTFKGGNPPVRLVNRTEFDSFLRRRAIENSASPLQDTFTELSGNTAFFRSGLKIDFQRMIGADGATSRVRRHVPRGRFNRPCPSLSVVVPLSETALAPFREKGLQVFFFRDLVGYGWLFPRREDAVAGIGSFTQTHIGFGDRMSRLLVHTGLGTSHPVRGAPIPAGKQRIFTGRGPYLLAGDAAGLCDRVSGEGISHAIESGLAAAEAVIRGDETWGAGTRCCEQVQQSLKYRHLLYGKPFRKIALMSLEAKDSWCRKYWSIVSGTAEYRDLFTLQ